MSSENTGKYVSCRLVVVALSLLVVLFATYTLYGYNAGKEYVGTRNEAIVELKTRPSPKSCNRQQCNLKLFKKYLRLEPNNSVIPRDCLASCSHVIYNNLPKTGSRSIKKVLQKLGTVNNFTAITPLTTFDLDQKKKELFIRMMSKVPDKPFIFMNHFEFGDFTSNFNDVIYINMIRDPVEWFRSSYFYWKYGDSHFHREQIKFNFLAQPIDDCVHSQSCFNSMMTRVNYWRFLAGYRQPTANHTYHREIPLTDDTMRRFYLVIGVYEQVDDFFEVLEFLLPHLFGGMRPVYKEIGEEWRTKFRTTYPSVDKFSETSRAELKRQLLPEYAFYQRIRDDFNELLTAVRRLKRQSDVESKEV